MSYYAPPNTSFFLVAYVDGTVRGARYETVVQDGGIVVDGAKLGLDALLSGEHVVQVVVYRDADGNGRLDRAVDRPCLVDGAVVTTRPERVNFSRFG